MLPLHLFGHVIGHDVIVDPGQCKSSLNGNISCQYAVPVYSVINTCNTSGADFNMNIAGPAFYPLLDDFRRKFFYLRMGNSFSRRLLWNPVPFVEHLDDF